MHSERRHERPLRRPGSGSGPTAADRNGRYRSAADANPPPLKRAPSFHDEKQESPDDSPVPFPCLAHTSGGERRMPPRSGDSVGIRTRDPQLRRLLLYPTELRNHFVKPSAEPNTGPKLSRGPKRSNDAPPFCGGRSGERGDKGNEKIKNRNPNDEIIRFYGPDSPPGPPGRTRGRTNSADFGRTACGLGNFVYLCRLSIPKRVGRYSIT